jgi:hypothetical protein
METYHRQRWEKSCLSKKRYSTLKLAEEVVAKVKSERNEDLYSYRCASCESWHLTKKPDHKGRYKVLKVV